MKALVLAAGFGTRLRPWTDTIPKPLFPVGGKPILSRMIDRLAAAGCEALAVNTHHLGPAVAAALAENDRNMTVILRHEPQILGTGGAIANLADFWDDHPFMVVNGDIVTDIDLAEVYRFHASHDDPVTLVMVDHPALNSVIVTPGGRIACLRPALREAQAAGVNGRLLTFTGIQVLDPLVLRFLPASGFSESITAFEKLMAAGYGIRAFRPTASWTDAGTPERYGRAAADALIPEAFEEAFGRSVHPGRVSWEPLAGDGSDRRWYRLRAGGDTLILADHGISAGKTPAEVDAVVALGRHLRQKNVPVPKILAAEPFAGQVVMEDFGDRNLQAVAAAATASEHLRHLYHRVIEVLIHMSAAGAQGFDPAWCHQSPRYDRQTIVEREGLYFMAAYVRTVAGLEIRDETVLPAFEHLARCIDRIAMLGFMHRDFQSRNIMVASGRIGVIDYQAGRIGPLAYDLASLLIDPYIDLPLDMQDTLLADAIARLGLSGTAAEDFARDYGYCALARNLQVLGAFGYLSQVKGKRGFAAYIGPALAGLKRRLAQIADPALEPLQTLVRRL